MKKTFVLNKLFCDFLIDMEKRIKCSIFRKIFLIIQDGAIHTVAFTEISDFGHSKKKNYNSILRKKRIISKVQMIFNCNKVLSTEATNVVC